MVHRKNESAWLALVPKNESGLVSRMAHLEGLAGIRAEPAPRAAALRLGAGRVRRARRPAAARGTTARVTSAGAGLDLEYGLGTGMTLVGAFNPDFGQVEVDPAVVNLTAFETFFEEKRPFFTEGSQVFLRFGRSGSSDYTSFFYPEPLLFYSRRIGRAPQGVASGDVRGRPGHDHDPRRGEARRPQRSGWNVGVLEAVTGREYARVADGRQPRASSRSSRSRTTSSAARSASSGRAGRSGC